MPMSRHSNRSEASGAGTAAHAALIRLFQEFHGSLVRLLRMRLCSDQEARDVAQEAYVRLLQLERLGAIKCLQSYLFRTALNIATDRLRSASMRDAAHRDPSFDPGIDELSPDRVALANDELRMVAAALASMPLKPRRAFVLHRLEDLDIGEVARRLGVSDRMVRNYVSQARLHCQAAITAVTRVHDSALPQIRPRSSIQQGACASRPAQNNQAGGVEV